MESEIVTAAIAIVGSVSFAVIYWQRFKGRLGEIRKFVDLLDDALVDDKITEREYRALWNAFMGIVGFKPHEIQDKGVRPR